MKIVIYGDFALDGRAVQLAKEGQFEQMLSEVIPVNKAFDYRIVNLECPIVTGDAKPIEKNGPAMKCAESGAELLRYALFDCVTLANNHFRDYGDEGVAQSLSALKKHGFDTVGGGHDIKEASRTLIKKIGDETLAVVNCTEHEFSIATDSQGGSNPIDPVEQYYAIKKAKEEADYVVVITHGGIEGYNMPTPRMKKWFRFFIDAGADAVVNHHQHCFSGYEVYQGKPIFYGLGNFFFDRPRCVKHRWNKGFALGLDLERQRVGFRLFPFSQCDGAPVLKMHGDDCQEGFLEDMEMLNKVIADEKALSDAQQQYMASSIGLNASLLTPYATHIGQALCEKGFLPNYYPKKKLVMLLNRIECESHRERLIHYIKDRIGQ